jgi:hypothetical protein
MRLPSLRSVGMRVWSVNIVASADMPNRCDNLIRRREHRHHDAASSPLWAMPYQSFMMNTGGCARRSDGLAGTCPGQSPDAYAALYELALRAISALSESFVSFDCTSSSAIDRARRPAQGVRRASRQSTERSKCGHAREWRRESVTPRSAPRSATTHRLCGHVVHDRPAKFAERRN